MPTRREVGLRHARHFAELLQGLSEAERKSPEGRSIKLHELDDAWEQIASARRWALENAPSDPEARRIVATLDDSGVEVAQVQAETRSALRRLKASLLTGDEESREG